MGLFFEHSNYAFVENEEEEEEKEDQKENINILKNVESRAKAVLGSKIISQNLRSFKFSTSLLLAWTVSAKKPFASDEDSEWLK